MTKRDDCCRRCLIRMRLITRLLRESNPPSTPRQGVTSPVGLGALQSTFRTVWRRRPQDPYGSRAPEEAAVKGGTEHPAGIGPAIFTLAR